MESAGGKTILIIVKDDKVEMIRYILRKFHQTELVPVEHVKLLI